MDVHGQLKRAQLENFSTAGRPAAGILGRMLFDTDLSSPMVDNGTSWIEVPNVDNVTIEKIANEVIRLKDGGITNDKLAVDSVFGNKLKDSGISTGKLVDQAVTFDKLAIDSVYGNRLKDAGIATGKIIDAAITHPKLANMAPVTNTFSSVTINTDVYTLKFSLNLTVTNANRPHRIALEPMGNETNYSSFYFGTTGCFLSLRIDSIVTKTLITEVGRVPSIDFGLVTGLAVGVRTVEVYARVVAAPDTATLEYGRLVAYPI